MVRKVKKWLLTMLLVALVVLATWQSWPNSYVPFLGAAIGLSISLLIDFIDSRTRLFR